MVLQCCSNQHLITKSMTMSNVMFYNHLGVVKVTSTSMKQEGFFNRRFFTFEEPNGDVQRIEQSNFVRKFKLNQRELESVIERLSK